MSGWSPAADEAGACAPSARDAVTSMWEERYDRILRVHGPALWRVARVYEADPGRQEDLFQEICLAVWKALPGFRGEASERTFVFRIAHNRGLSHSWSRPPAPADPRELDGLIDGAPDPEQESVRSERRDHLMAAIRLLSPVPRQVVTLSLEGLSHREIAEILGITENNVAVRLSRARATLSELLVPPAEGGRETCRTGS